MNGVYWGGVRWVAHPTPSREVVWYTVLSTSCGGGWVCACARGAREGAACAAQKCSEAGLCTSTKEHTGRTERVHREQDYAASLERIDHHGAMTVCAGSGR